MFDELLRGPAQLAIWRRELPRGFEGFCSRGVERLRESFERELPSNAISGLRENAELAAVLSSFQEGPERDWLAADLERLAFEIVRRARAKRFKLFLGRVDTDRCRKFHVDYLRLRAITTYFGPATEWIRPSDVDRAALENPAVCPVEANRNVLLSGGETQRARAGDVLLLKGALFDARSLGAVHRSPPVEHAHLARLVAILTPLDG